MKRKPLRQTDDRMTPYQKHKSQWINCTRCHYHEKREKVCVMRGQIPCDILFIGEAPGVSEDSIGTPFIGPAGQLLDHIILSALGEDHGVRIAFTNLVGCIPIEVEDDKGKKSVEPDEESIEACQPRVEEFVKLCRPKVIVTVGKLSREWLEPGIKGNHDIPRSIPRIDIIHPSAMLRAPADQREQWERIARIRIAKCVRDYVSLDDKE